MLSPPRNFSDVRWIWLEQVCGHALFSALVVLFGSVVLTNSIDAPTHVFLWLLVPLFVLHLLLPDERDGLWAPVERVRWLARSRILQAALCYLVVLLISTCFREDIPGDLLRQILGRTSQWSAEYIVFLAATAYLAATYPDFVRRFFLVVMVMLAINAAINVEAFLNQPAHLPFAANRLAAVFGTPLFRNATHVSPLFTIYAMGALGLLVTMRLRASERLLLGISAATLIVAVMLTQSRGAIVACAVGAMLLAGVSSRTWRPRILIATGLFFLAILLVPPARDALFMRGDSFRLGLARTYLQLTWNEHPWMGFGLDRMLWVTVDGLPFEQPHNAIIWGQVRGGVIAALAAAFMLFGSLFWTFRAWRGTRNIALFMSVLMLCITSFTEIGFMVIPFGWILITFWLPVGLGAGAELTFKRPAPADAAAIRATPLAASVISSR